ncbi:BNR-4 repeat-containing protein [Thalassotalea agariperforans]
MIKKIKYSIMAMLSASVLFSSVSAAISEQEFFEKRDALIIKHSHQDSTFAALQNEKSFSKEYWRWRVDQYLYGQYTEYQPIYDAYTQGKSFHEIYNLPTENLGPKWQKPNNLPSIPEGYFTDNLPGNTYTGWHKLVGNKVYITYQGHLTDPYVASYDLTSNQWNGPYKAGHSTLSKGDRKIDSHGRPIIEVDSQGYIHIVFGGHGGEREDGLNPLSIDTPHAGGRMKHVVSTKPYDLSQFVEKNDISPFASYTRSYKMANGDIYFFTRAGTHKSPWVYYKMHNGSQTFEPPVVVTWPTPDKNDPIKVDTHYITPLKVSDTEIAITSLWHACNFKEEHDKTHYNRLNAYYMKLDTTNDTFYNIKNEPLTLPLTLAATNKYTLAYNSEKTNETSFGTKPLVLEDGRYAVAYEARGKDYREWRMALFEDGQWSHGHPMPGTVNRTLRDINGKNIQKIKTLEVLKENDAGVSAAVIYQNSKNETVFAVAKKIDNLDNNKQNWQVEKTYFSVAKGKLQMEPVKDAAGDTLAVIVNVKKGDSQRLYLWHDGKFRANP